MDQSSAGKTTRHHSKKGNIQVSATKQDTPMRKYINAGSFAVHTARTRTSSNPLIAFSSARVTGFHPRLLPLLQGCAGCVCLAFTFRGIMLGPTSRYLSFYCRRLPTNGPPPIVFEWVSQIRTYQPTFAQAPSKCFMHIQLLLWCGICKLQIPTEKSVGLTRESSVCKSEASRSKNTLTACHHRLPNRAHGQCNAVYTPSCKVPLVSMIHSRRNIVLARLQCDAFSVDQKIDTTM